MTEKNTVLGRDMAPDIQYYINIPSQVHVAVANTKHWDLFNGNGSNLVRVRSIKQLPNLTTAVAGVVFDWSLNRTSAVGTGGGALTPWLPDLSQAALPAGITARSKPTGGATDGVLLLNYSISSEETNAATQMVAMMMMGGPADLVPYPLRQTKAGILLRPGQGLECIQITNSAAGNTGWLIGFSVETG